MKLNPSVLEFYRSNPVTEIDLEAEPQDIEQMRVFAEILANHATINVLLFAGSNITDEQMQILMPAIAASRSLRVLDLSDNPLTEIGIEYLVTAFGQNHFLQVVNLSRVNLTPRSKALLNQRLIDSKSLVRFIPEDILSPIVVKTISENKSWKYIGEYSSIFSKPNFSVESAAKALKEIHTLAVAKRPELFDHEESHGLGEQAISAAFR